MGEPEPTLFDAVKRKLRVRWSDPDTDAHISRDIMPDAEAAIRSKVGIPEGSPIEDGQERMLFLALCYYMWNDAEDEFDANYAVDIAQARRRREVMQYVEEKEGAAVV